uniref:Uncharacterized protein n=1 Tax=Loa loa TaxID=7209 RepID=A0A1I7V8L0_LOALO
MIPSVQKQRKGGRGRGGKEEAMTNPNIEEASKTVQIRSHSDIQNEILGNDASIKYCYSNDNNDGYDDDGSVGGDCDGGNFGVAGEEVDERRVPSQRAHMCCYSEFPLSSFGF